MYQVAVAGSKAPRSVVPSPLKSPTTGVEPTGPKANTRSATPALALLRRNQVAVVGSKVPMVAWPSPSQSPTTGMLPRGPKANVASGAPGPPSRRTNQVAVLGSKATTPDGGSGARVASVAVEPAVVVEGGLTGAGPPGGHVAGELTDAVPPTVAVRV